jgi:hypothetical protein
MSLLIVDKRYQFSCALQIVLSIWKIIIPEIGIKINTKQG